MLAAFQAAPPPPSAAAAAAVTVAVSTQPPPLALASSAHLSPAPLSRLRFGEEPAATEQRPASPPAPAPPDLDALADYVLERLRGELRDGRERLGFLLDDSH